MGSEITSRNPANSQSGNRHYLSFALSALAACAIIAAVFTFMYVPSTKSAVMLATTQQPEKLTELSFINPNKLPKELESGQPVSFDFNVTNHMNKAVNYTPKVTLIENGIMRPLENYNFILSNRESRNITVSFSTPKSNTSVEVIVTLPNVDQSIHFRGHS